MAPFVTQGTSVTFTRLFPYMKTTPILQLKAVLSLILLVAISPWARAQSEAITINKIFYSTQSSASTVTPQLMPYSLLININGSAAHPMTNWGPAFYKPGSGGTPQSGASTATNTGTLNFSATPNNGGDFAFLHDFATASDLATTYPDGQYGIKFLGSTPPSPAEFTAALNFQSGTFPATAPRIASVDNGAIWSNNVLMLDSAGTTTLTLNSFPEYGTNANGAIVGVGIYSDTGVIGAASIEKYDLPTLGHHDPFPSQVSINGDWLIPGKTYTLEIQYAVIASPPTEAYLTAPGATSATNWQGLATYRKNTTLSIAVKDTTSNAVQSDFNGDGHPDIIWQHAVTGQRYLWYLNGATTIGDAALDTLPVEWSIVGNADFNGDGHNDLVLENTSTGERRIRYLNGATYLSEASLGIVAVDWHIVAVGDLNGDGHPDLVWEQASTGQRYVWFMNGTYTVSDASLGVVAVDWHIVAAADFNGDHKADLVWENAATGMRYLWYMNGATTVGDANLGTIAVDWHIVGASDINGDGKTDLIWEHAVTGQRYLWYMNGATTVGDADLGVVQRDWHIAN